MVNMLKGTVFILFILFYFVCIVTSTHSIFCQSHFVIILFQVLADFISTHSICNWQCFFEYVSYTTLNIYMKTVLTEVKCGCVASRFISFI